MVVIDFIFIRHAQRATITKAVLQKGAQPSITQEGRLKSIAWGKSINKSAFFFRGTYDAVECFASSFARNQETAKAILTGLTSNNCIIDFARHPGDFSDSLLRLRRDNLHWDEKKVAIIAQQLVKKGSRYHSLIEERAKKIKKEYLLKKVLVHLEDLMNRDNSHLYQALLPFLAEKRAKECAAKLSVTLYDLLMDKKEVALYLERPLTFIIQKINEYSLQDKKHILIIGVTHDFNLAGLAKGIIKNASLQKLGGIPGYLSHLHLRITSDGMKVKHLTVYYNDKKKQMNSLIKERILKGTSFKP